MPRCFRLHLAVFVGTTLLVLLVGGCPLLDWLERWGPEGGSQGEPKLAPFASPEELLGYFKEQASARFTRGFGRDFFWGGLPFAAPAFDAEMADGAEAGGAGGDEAFSTTNLQEIGVDESDVFKSDGTYFYIAKGQSLRIVQASPTERMAEVGRLDLEVSIASLYLLDATVIALGMKYGGYAPDVPELLVWPPYYQGSSLVVYQVDVSDPTSPAVVAQVELDGSLVSSRLTNGRLIAVLTVVPALPADPNPQNINLMNLEQVLPKLRRSNGRAEMVPWQSWLRPESPDGYNMTAVVTLDADDIESVVHSVAVIANAGTIYASPEALYITDAEYDPRDNVREKTAIHKFAFDEDGAARYAASGSVPGRLLNQFSLGEHEGYLRVATHVSDFGMFPARIGGGVGMARAAAGSADAASPDESAASAADALVPELEPTGPYNAVYVLGEVAGKLEVTGSLEGLAPNERIYAARFMGERGFLVTFRKVDPLFALALADPRAPRVVGTLKIPGFSDYLHPLGENHLIGVGNSVTPGEFGGLWWDKLQLSLFDVSDLSNPTLVQQLELGGFRSWAEVKYTHKAFTLIQREGRTLLGLPAHLTPADTPPETWGATQFAGVLCLQVDPASGFAELGRVEAVGSDPRRASRWQRAAFIGDELYALTAEGVRAASLSDFTATHAVTLAE